ncbi:MAG: M20 family metallopeptidase [Candidatus Hodarchaeota archaeon]
MWQKQAIEREKMQEAEKEVLQNIKRERILHILQEIVSRPSINPPGDEIKVVEYLKGLFAEMNLEPEYQWVLSNRPNILAKIKGEEAGPNLLFLGHTDVVPVENPDAWRFDPWSGQIEGERLYGRGSSDMKGGIAAFLAAMEAIQLSGVRLKGDAIFAGVVDEEVSGKGTMHLVDTGFVKQIDGAIVGEPSKMKIEIAHRGTCWLDVRTYGVPAHGSLPHKGVNAIAKMCKFLKGLLQVKFRFKSHDLLPDPSINVGKISGGIKINIVPSICEAQIDIRIVPGMNREDVIAPIQEFIDELKEEDPEFKVEIKIAQFRKPFQIGKNEHIVQTVSRSAEKILGKKIELSGFPAYTDAGFIQNIAKKPVVVFGPGEQAHTDNESVIIENVVDAAKIYAMTILDFCGTKA